MIESKVEWLGLIPETWNIVMLSSIFDEHKKKNKGLVCNNLLSLSYGKIKQKDINSNEGLLPASFEGYNIIEPGDIVLRLTDLQNDQKSLRTGISYSDGIVTSAYVTLRKKTDLADPEYMHFLLHAFDISKGFYGMGDGVRQGLSFDGIKNIKLLLPPFSIQKKIVSILKHYLDNVDDLIKVQEMQIEQLKGLKKSVISSSVMAHSDFNFVVENTEIKPIGNLPDGWKIYRFKDFCKEKSVPNTGDRELLSVYLDRGVIRYSDSTTLQVHKPSESLDKYQNVDENDFVMNNQQAWRGSVGVSKYKGIISPAYLIFTFTEKCNTDYMNYLLRDNIMVQQFEISSRGVGNIQRNIYSPWLKQCFLPIPPYDEQCKIAAYLNQKSKEIDDLIQIKQNKIDLLQEYKKSLIYEYVTGKKEVV